MPYIPQSERDSIDAGHEPETPGQLNYAISRMIDKYLSRKGPIRYTHVNEVVGVLECAKLELYRRIAAPYEDLKITENGDVYVV